MNLLGFDTSTAATAACVLRADGEAFELAPAPEELGAPPAHARELLPALASVMERAGLSWEELDSVAIGAGPGTFTGLRIGIATARGLAAGRPRLALRPVSSLAALAEGIEGPERLALIDARRGEVYAGLYVDGEAVWSPYPATPEAVAERAREGGLTPVAAGDGALRFRGLLEANGVRVEPDDSGAHVVRALHVCRLALAAPEVPAQALLPDYLRNPDVSLPK